MQFERRTTSAEVPGTALAEVQHILDELKSEDPEFQASAKLLFDRAPFETPANHPIATLLERAVHSTGRQSHRGGVSFWTDAAVLSSASIPTVVFGPGGQGLHSTEEYVRVSEVLACRDALVELAREFC
jgi:acetylornithine deacetylase